MNDNNTNETKSKYRIFNKFPILLEWWFILLAVLLLPPLGFVLMWFSPKLHTALKVVFTFILAFYTLIYVAVFYVITNYEESHNNYAIVEHVEDLHYPLLEDTYLEDSEYEDIYYELEYEAEYTQYQGYIDYDYNPNDNVENQSGLTQATVSRVIDGDTIVLTTGERVRFIGVDAPEIGERGADEATAFVRDKLNSSHNTIWLESDGNDLDRFGRLRRYIWLEKPTDITSEDEIRSKMLNAKLLENGHAIVAIFGNVRNEDLFRRIAILQYFENEAVVVPDTSVAESTQSNEVADERMVYVTPRGQSYHARENCRTLARSRTINSIPISRTGSRTACNVCW